jgi:hypothetical protein
LPVPSHHHHHPTATSGCPDHQHRKLPICARIADMTQVGLCPYGSPVAAEAEHVCAADTPPPTLTMACSAAVAAAAAAVFTAGPLVLLV